MTVQQRVALYESGAIIGHELVVDCLGMVDPGDPSAILGHLPAETLPRLREFLDRYRPGEMRTLHGKAIPTQGQVLAARRWLDPEDREGRAKDQEPKAGPIRRAISS